ncbi:MAG: HEPN domain-containing protein [Candidatus Brockarchaeota archaeon]|nr:HEPN domain-containing protein [Candidatus Brockarchaeota archaeon]
MVERSRDWMKQAERDLENAKYEMKGGFYEWACFLSQQAAEKAIKAVFQRLNMEAFGHSVYGLLVKLPEKYTVGRELLEKAMELDKAYIPTRYPNSIPEGAPFEVYTEGEAKRLISHAEEIIGFCKGILSGNR